MMTYRKIGGMHWLFIGRVRFTWCIKRRETVKLQPITHWNLGRRYDDSYKPLPRIDNTSNLLNW